MKIRSFLSGLLFRSSEKISLIFPPFFFNVGLLQPTAFKAGKFGFFLFASEMFVFPVKLYSETFTRTLQRFLQPFNQLNVIFLYIFKMGTTFIALSRVYFTLGGIDGPEKDQILKLVDELVSFQALSPLICRANCRSFGMMVTLFAWIAHRLESSSNPTK